MGYPRITPARSAMLRLLEPVARVRANGLAMSVSALVALAALALPWLRFETTFDLSLEPGALESFQYYYAPAGPLDAFTRLPPYGIGMVVQMGAGAVIAGEVLIL